VLYWSGDASPERLNKSASLGIVGSENYKGWQLEQGDASQNSDLDRFVGFSSCSLQ
jgi:hypothetical protein